MSEKPKGIRLNMLFVYIFMLLSGILLVNNELQLAIIATLYCIVHLLILIERRGTL